MKVVVASSSAYRRRWYLDELSRYGFEVMIAKDALECLHAIEREHPETIILETHLNWGGTEGVLALRAENPDLARIPVLLVAADGISSRVYGLAPYQIQGFFGRVPSSHALITSLRLIGLSKSTERHVAR